MKLYPYQEQVKDVIQSGKSVILQAPTGGGKTRAGLAPYIHAFFDFEAVRFPKKCIYSVPMRTLANQFEAEYRELAAVYRRKHRREINVTIQTGERGMCQEVETRKLENYRLMVEETAKGSWPAKMEAGSGSGSRVGLMGWSSVLWVAKSSGWG